MPTETIGYARVMSLKTDLRGLRPLAVSPWALLLPSVLSKLIVTK